MVNMYQKVCVNRHLDCKNWCFLVGLNIAFQAKFRYNDIDYEYVCSKKGAFDWID